MKNLYKKGKVHPSPPATTGGDQYYLALHLPATILTLAAALSPEDKQVLAYLISCCGAAAPITSENSLIVSSNRRKTGSGGGGDHEPVFECNCFRCYMSFWARWDASPNRQLIHEIIEVYEEDFFEENKKSTTAPKQKKKKKKKRGKRACNHDETRNGEKDELAELGSVMEVSSDLEVAGGADQHGDRDEVQVVEPEKGSSMRKIASFLQEKIWDFLSKRKN